MKINFTETTAQISVDPEKFTNHFYARDKDKRPRSSSEENVNTFLTVSKSLTIDTIFGGNNANELNASYAADGYARVRGVGALITAFGVGELSSMDGIAGSCTEKIPVIHIMASMISCASTNITVSNAVSEIDRVISTAVISKRPAYIGLPCDLVFSLVQVPTHFPLCLVPTTSPAKPLSVACSLIIKEIRSVKHPVIIANAGVIRLHLEAEANAFIERSGFPTYVAPMGRGGVNAEIVNYRGVYCGILSLDGIQQELEHADLLIELGPVKFDGYTGNFSSALDGVKTISFTVIVYAKYNGVRMHELLSILMKGLPTAKKTLDLGPLVKPVAINHELEEITCNYLWNKVGEYIKPNSIVVTETGFSGFAVFNAPHFKEATYINQILWVSIGYSVPAALGASMAARHRQVCLFVGDGSFQLTAQEISKLINDPHRDYNNLRMWEYRKALTFFGGNLATNKTKNPAEIGLRVQVKTRKAFEAAMETVNQEPNKIRFLELVMPQFDAPRELFILTKSAY
ncbi:hypothetical protein MFLAVUS_003032 [Mucor flavus]|uniref:Pyruvate decarboxylase n=1 Tax=Mucor flavus TaxID=439312 RepID=A0ABP9YRX5_9FUNG